MTNYNEKLDKIIANVSGKSFDAAINNPNNYAQVVIDAEAEAKQALTSLIKELVAEARLDERQMLNFHRAYGKDYQATLETLEEANDDRIAELKAQQEEV